MPMKTEKDAAAPTENLPVVSGQGQMYKSSRTMRGIDSTDILWPYVLLMQPTSKFLAEAGSVLRPGQFANSLTKKEIADTTFVPMVATKRYHGLKSDGSLEFTTMDKFDPRLEGRSYWSDKATGLKASARVSLQIVALFAGKPMVMTFAKSSYRTGKQLLSLITYAERPMHELKYKLATHTETNDKGTFYVMDVQQLGESTEHERKAVDMFLDSFLPHIDKAAELSEETPF